MTEEEAPQEEEETPESEEAPATGDGMETPA